MTPVLLRLHGRETRPKRTAGGYITEAFDRVLGEIDEVKAQNLELKAMIGEQNGKIDAILRSITGLGNL